MNDFFTAFQELEEVLGSLENIMGSAEAIFGGIGAIFSVISTGISILVAIITAIFTIIFVIFHAIPVYSLAKKVGLKYAWLSWIPFFNNYFRLFVISEIAGNKPFVPNLGKFKIENRKLSFLAYVLIKNFAGLIVAVISGVASMVIPIVGSISLVLGLIPTAACAWIEYVYLRDLLDIFKEDKKSNNTTSIIITVIDALLPFDLIRTGYLYTLMKKQPLPEKEIVIENAPSSEASTVSVNNSAE